MGTSARYALIITASALVVLNPVVLYLVTGSRSVAALTLLLDLCLVTIALFAILHLRRGTRRWFHLMVLAVVATLPALLVGEIAFTYLRYQYGDRLLGEVPQLFRDDSDLVYTMIPNATGRHSAAGEFDVEYVIDAKGRKRIDYTGPEPERRLHVFGDSFTFGFGVANADTWLNLLQERVDDRLRIYNYGVMGYSLEQMYLSLRRNAEEVQAGDLVVFTPIAADLERSLIGKSYVCGGRIRAEGNERFPKLENGRWIYVELADECSFVLDTLLANSPLPLGFGAAYRALLQRARLGAMVANADRIFALAKDLVTDRGADFDVIFIASADECMAGRLSLPIDGLQTATRSFLPACPSDPETARALKFRHDGHWSPIGHRWAADTLAGLVQEWLDEPGTVAQSRSAD